jgi:hypothetical protein
MVGHIKMVVKEIRSKLDNFMWLRRGQGQGAVTNTQYVELCDETSEC